VKTAARRANRREAILSATETLLRTRGLSGTTTRLIAKTVGCSEGAIYVHFKSRVELLLAVLEHSLADLREPLRGLNATGGRGTPAASLENVAHGMLSFHRKVTPMLAALFSEPDLLAAYRKSLARESKGPHRAIAHIAAYLRAQQVDGRIDAALDPQAAATLLMAASFFRAFTEEFFGVPVRPPAGEYFKHVLALIGVRSRSGTRKKKM
jgi:AcrR family transcriptional regulator